MPLCNCPFGEGDTDNACRRATIFAHVQRVRYRRGDMHVGQQSEGFRLVCLRASCRLHVTRGTECQTSSLKRQMTAGKVYNDGAMQYNNMDGKMPWCAVLMYVGQKTPNFDQRPDIARSRRRVSAKQCQDIGRWKGGIVRSSATCY
jgi:hypothetical protein